MPQPINRECSLIQNTTLKPNWFIMVLFYSTRWGVLTLLLLMASWHQVTTQDYQCEFPLYFVVWLMLMHYLLRWSTERWFNYWGNKEEDWSHWFPAGYWDPRIWPSTPGPLLWKCWYLSRPTRTLCQPTNRHQRSCLSSWHSIGNEGSSQNVAWTKPIYSNVSNIDQHLTEVT